MKWKGRKVTPELVTEARRVCRKYCRAVACENGCTNSWPGDGSGAWFSVNFEEAAAALAEKGTPE